MEHSRALQEWQSLNSAARSDVELMFIHHLQEIYPQHKVTRINPKECDVIGFAHAALATAIRDDKAENHTVKTFKGPKSRLQEESGTLDEDIKFGRWMYQWDENEYIIYQTNYEIPFRPPQRSVYVLSQKAVNDDGQVTEDDNGRTDALLLAVGKWSSELHDEIYVFDDQAWGKDKMLWESVKSSSWDDVILNPAMKHNLISDVQGFFDNQTLYQKLSVPWKRGIILHGVPGNGKTISIKALINSLHLRSPSVPSLYVKSFDGNCHGPKWSIHEIFKHARMMAPCLLIFEDLDSLVTPKTRSYFLNEVDGLKSNDGILMVGSTNHLDRLDPGIAKRPSRFDRKYFFPNPDSAQRVLYAKFWQGKLKDNKDVKFPDELCDKVAEITDGFSFAYMQEAFVASLLAIAVRGGKNHEDAVDADKWSGPHDPLTKLEVQGGGDSDVEKLELWVELQKQVKILRDEIDDTADAQKKGKKGKKGKKEKKEKKKSKKESLPSVLNEMGPLARYSAELDALKILGAEETSVPRRPRAGVDTLTRYRDELDALLHGEDQGGPLTRLSAERQSEESRRLAEAMELLSAQRD
jgi:transitional endoplasmic reticulum ATPase